MCILYIYIFFFYIPIWMKGQNKSYHQICMLNKLILFTPLVEICNLTQPRVYLAPLGIVHVASREHPFYARLSSLLHHQVTRCVALQLPLEQVTARGIPCSMSFRTD